MRETEALTLVFSVSEEENNSTSKVTLAITHTSDIKSKILYLKCVVLAVWESLVVLQLLKLFKRRCKRKPFHFFV